MTLLLNHSPCRKKKKGYREVQIDTQQLKMYDSMILQNIYILNVKCVLKSTLAPGSAYVKHIR